MQDKPGDNDQNNFDSTPRPPEPPFEPPFPHDNMDFDDPDTSDSSPTPPSPHEEDSEAGSRPTPPIYSSPRPARRPTPYTTGNRRRPGEATKRRPHPQDDSFDGPSQEEYPRRRPGDTSRPSRPSDEYPLRRRPLEDDIDDTPPHSRRREDRTDAPPSYRHEDRADTPPGRRQDGRRPRRRARRRTQLSALYIFIIVAVVGISLTAFAMAFPRMFDPDREAAVAATPSPSPTPTPLPINTRNMTGHITNINAQTIIMLDITANRSMTFEFTETTTLNNRFGQAMPFEDLSVGKLMDIAFDPDTNELFSLRQTVTRDVVPADMRFDMEYSTITVGNDTFNFSDQTLVLRRGVPFEIGDITPEDMVTLVTLSNFVWTIDVESARGFLRFTNYESIVEGRVIMNPVGPGIHRFANIEDTITLPEGTYVVTVEGRNIESYVTEVTIYYGQTTVIDLEDVDLGAAVLELTVTPSGSRVFINGELTSVHSALEFEFGENVSIRVERDGFYTQQRTVEMDQAVVSINITLVEETPEPETALLSVSTTPSGAQIWINQQFIGFSPILTELEPGGYTILATVTGFYDYEIFIDVLPGDNNRTLNMIQVTEQPPQEYEPNPPPEEEPPWIPDPYQEGEISTYPEYDPYGGEE